MAAVIPTMGADFGCFSSQLGKLGFFAMFESQKAMAYAVTCSHNFAPAYRSPVTAPDPGLPNQDQAFLPWELADSEHFVGYSVWANSLVFGKDIDYDCAIARLVVTPDSIAGGAVINKFWTDADLPASVQLVVANSQTIAATVKPDQAAISEPFPVPGRTEGLFSYLNLFAADYTPLPDGTPPIHEGMSGAPLITADGWLVGIHVAGRGNTGFFHRADGVLRRLGMQLYLW